MTGRRPSDPEAQLGLKIARARRSSALTQASLAKRASIDRTALSKIETGHRKVSSRELARMAEALGLSLESLFSESEDAEPTDLLHVIRARSKAIMEICNRYGAHSPRVFGSVARGEATPGSDIDLLIEMGPGRSLLDQAGLVVDLHELLGHDVDVVTSDALRPRIRQRVLAEAIPL